jgi:hypothetical protein
MSKIISWAHLTASWADYPNQTKHINQFAKDVAESIENMQNNNLEVEVQYQQSDFMCSVLIFGREKESDKK